MKSVLRGQTLHKYTTMKWDAFFSFLQNIYVFVLFFTCCISFCLLVFLLLLFKYLCKSIQTTELKLRTRCVCVCVRTPRRIVSRFSRSIYFEKSVRWNAERIAKTSHNLWAHSQWIYDQTNNKKVPRAYINPSSMISEWHFKIHYTSNRVRNFSSCLMFGFASLNIA